MNESIKHQSATIFDYIRARDVEGLSLHISGCHNFTEYTNSVDWAGNTALHLACILQEDEICALLVDRGASINAQDHIGKKPLQYLRDKRIANDLQKRSSLIIDEEPDEYETYFKSLEEETFNGNNDYIKTIISEDLSRSNPTNLLKHQDQRGNTLLMYACMRNHVDLALWLVSNGADIHVCLL